MRDLLSESLEEPFRQLGFRRVVLKNWNSTYSPGKENKDWLVVEKLNPAR